MTGFLWWLRQLDYTYILDLLISAGAALICITIHESAHGLVAYWLGDSTAKDAGRISLNPIKHVDIIGLIMLALAHVGWAKPVPIRMQNFKNPKLGMAISAFAGPVSNLLLAFISLIGYYLCFHLVDSFAGEYLVRFLYQLAMINCGLAVFNFLPIPPLDGSKVLFALLPQSLYVRLMRIERYGMFLLIILVWVGAMDGVLSQGITWIVDRIWSAVCGIMSFFT